MAEWSKAHDWKSCVPPKGTVSSNLTLSAIYKKSTRKGVFFVNPRHPQGCFFCKSEGSRDLNSREVSLTTNERRAGARRSA